MLGVDVCAGAGVGVARRENSCRASSAGDWPAAEDAMAAARLVYALRATTMPCGGCAGPDDPPPEQEQRERQQPEPNAPLEDIVIEAVRAAIPHDLLAQLRPQAATSARAGAAGAAGAAAQGAPGPAGRLARGRPVRRIEAACHRYAAFRRALANASPSDASGCRHAPRNRRARRFPHHPVSTSQRDADDFRGRCVRFVGDSSSGGSQGRGRIAARRLLCPPRSGGADRFSRAGRRIAAAADAFADTREAHVSVRSRAAAARRSPSAIDAARLLCEQSMRKGQTPMVVMLTDGRGNIARDGSQGREAAERDSLAAARAIRAIGMTSLMVDTSPSPHPAARKLAGDMSARYIAAAARGCCDIVGCSARVHLRRGSGMTGSSVPVRGHAAGSAEKCG